MEAIVFQTVSHFFGDGIKINSRRFLGGGSCAQQVDGSRECEDRTKGAYSDIPLVLPCGSVIFVEVDENCHVNYDPSCELARYDTLRFGADIELNKDVYVLRFNPHNTDEITFSLLDRLKVLIERLYRLMEMESVAVKDPAAIGVLQVQFMFYSKDSPHMHAARLATSTLTVGDDIDDLNMPLRQRVKEFELSDLKQEAFDETVSAELMEQTRLLQSSLKCCTALSSPDNPKKRKRCSGAPCKDGGGLLCRRHFNQDALFKSGDRKKPVVYYE